MYQPKYQPPKHLYIDSHIPYIDGNIDRYVVSTSTANRHSSAGLQEALDKKLPRLPLCPRHLALCISLHQLLLLQGSKYCVSVLKDHQNVVLPIISSCTSSCPSLLRDTEVPVIWFPCAPEYFCVHTHLQKQSPGPPKLPSPYWDRPWGGIKWSLRQSSSLWILIPPTCANSRVWFLLETLTESWS